MNNPPTPVFPSLYPKQASSPAREGSIIRIDLHGCSRVAAERLILDTLEVEASRFDLQKLFIITGRGKHHNPGGKRAVLLNWLPTWLTSCKFKDRIHSVTAGVGVYEVTLKTLAKHTVKTAREEAMVHGMLRVVTSQEALKALIAKKHKSAEEYATLGNYYIKGVHVERKVVLGIQYLNIAARRGNLYAIELLSSYYHRGIPGQLKPNPKKAAALAERALKKGTRNADLMLHLLASCYTLGRGCPQDDRKAFALLEESSRLGNPHSQFALAMMYHDGGRFSNGFSVPQNFPAAYRLLTCAAAQGINEAYRKLALMYERGSGVEKSLSNALQWYEKGAATGDVFCLYNVGIIYLGHAGEFEQPINPVKGVAYLKQAVKLDDVDAELALGKCFLRGNGVVNNLSEAKRLCQLAKAHGNKLAHYWLGVIAVLNNNPIEANAELNAGAKLACPMSKNLLKQLRGWRWFDKSEEECSDSVRDILNDPKQWLRDNKTWLMNNEAILPIFGQIAAADTLGYFESIDPNEFCCNQPSIEGIRIVLVFLYQTGMANHHEVMLNSQRLLALVYLNRESVDEADKVLKQSILPNLLDFHPDKQKEAAKKLQKYILHIQVAKKFLQKNALDKALSAFQKALTIFIVSDVEYFLLNPSMALIHAEIESIHQLTGTQNDTRVLLPIFSTVILAYLKSLSRVLGTGSDHRPLADIHEKQYYVSLPSFWLNQLDDRAITEITTKLRVNDRMLFKCHSETAFFDKPAMNTSLSTGLSVAPPTDTAAIREGKVCSHSCSA